VGLGDHLRDREPEPGASAGACLVGASEALERARKELGRESRPFVDDVELDDADFHGPRSWHVSHEDDGEMRAAMDAACSTTPEQPSRDDRKGERKKP
jgi:hypothetical protein